MIENLKKIFEFFDRHPWDWLAHLVLGFAVFWLNWGFWELIGWPPFPLSIAGTINFLIAVELVQWDIFGISWQMIWDSTIDLFAGALGIELAIIFMGMG